MTTKKTGSKNIKARNCVNKDCVGYNKTTILPKMHSLDLGVKGIAKHEVDSRLTSKYGKDTVKRSVYYREMECAATMVKINQPLRDDDITKEPLNKNKPRCKKMILLNDHDKHRSLTVLNKSNIDEFCDDSSVYLGNRTLRDIKFSAGNKTQRQPVYKFSHNNAASPIMYPSKSYDQKRLQPKKVHLKEEHFVWGNSYMLDIYQDTKPPIVNLSAIYPKLGYDRETKNYINEYDPDFFAKLDLETKEMIIIEGLARLYQKKHRK